MHAEWQRFGALDLAFISFWISWTVFSRPVGWQIVFLQELIISSPLNQREKMLATHFLVALILCLLSATFANQLFDFSAEDAYGNAVPLSKYKDSKVILIGELMLTFLRKSYRAWRCRYVVVNVATNCGFTYTNYQQLIDLYEKYHKRGLEILAFPCNQFGEQEPGSNEEIQNFVKNFGVSFPVFSKVISAKLKVISYK